MRCTSFHLAVLCSVALLCACQKLPSGRQSISAVEVQGARAVDEDEIRDGLATAETERFLGFEGVLFDYEVFDEDVLARDLQRIERYYRARGYYEAKVTAARVIQLDTDHVRVEVRVDEGEPVMTAFPVTVRGHEKLQPEVVRAVQRARSLEPGDIFDEGKFEATKKGIALALADYGHAFVKVTGKATVDIARHSAVVVFDVEPGPIAQYGPIAIEGNDDIPEDVMRDVMGIQQGDEYSHSELEAARRALVDLGVFATVDIRTDTTKQETRQVPVTILVQPTQLKTVRLGGGMRFDSLRLSTHLQAGWEHRNFLGGARRFSVSTRPGIVFFPTRIPSSTNDRVESPRRLLFENYSSVELEQPAFLEARTKGRLRTEFNRYPLLYEDETDDKSSNILGFNESRSKASLERKFFTNHLAVEPSYNLRANFPFSYNDKKLRDGVRTLIISFPELKAVLDFRDDPVRPRNGVFASAAVQVAGYVFQGDASDLKLKPELRWYKDLQLGNLVLAGRTTMGFLFPDNYSSNPDGDINDPTVIRNQQILLFRGFFSGGPNSNRGYPFRQVGPHAVLGFLIPNTAACEGANLPNRCTDERPLGGMTLWEASLELRFPILGAFDGAMFIEGSDVTSTVGQVRFSRPHLSTGFGLRYDTPVGPIRLDAGYRIPKLQAVGEDEPIPGEGNPGEILGLPMAIHFALGEAF